MHIKVFMLFKSTFFGHKNSIIANVVILLQYYVTADRIVVMELMIDMVHRYFAVMNFLFHLKKHYYLGLPEIRLLIINMSSIYLKG